MPGFTPDGNRVSGSSMGLIGFLTCDSSGTVLFTEGSRIRKIKGGVVTTVANSVGVSGVSGDGGSALNAQFMNPLGLALASNGDIYVADSFANRIRLIKGNTGIVTTIAGTGVAASSGDGGPAVNANLDSPIALSLDGNGNLFVSETYFVRKINLSTNIITTIAGDASAFNFRDDVLATTTSLLRPNAIFADQSGNIFISDSANYRVRKVSVVTGFISTVAGNGSAQFSGDGGSATAAGLQPSGGLTLDQSQNLYISDTSGRIRMTQVSACFFTLSTPTLSIGPRGGTGSLAITATNSSCPYSVSPSSSYVTITNGNTGTGSGTIAFSVTANTGAARTATVSLAGQSFTITQPASSPQYNVGFFQPSGPQWVLDSNGNGVYDAADKLFSFAGQAGAIAVVGDWNGDGRSKVGYYLNGFWALDYNGNGVYDAGVDKFYACGGGPGYIPVVGDWNGDGRTKIGYYHDGFGRSIQMATAPSMLAMGSLVMVAVGRGKFQLSAIGMGIIEPKSGFSLTAPGFWIMTVMAALAQPISITPTSLMQRETSPWSVTGTVTGRRRSEFTVADFGYWITTGTETTMASAPGPTSSTGSAATRARPRWLRIGMAMAKARSVCI